MKYMKTDERGSVAAVVTISILTILLIGAGAFGFWSFTERQDYKNNVDKKIQVAVSENTKKVKSEEAVAYAEEAKNPLKTYIGPESYGAINIIYPKSWSAYDAHDAGSSPVNFYAYPDIVPSVSARTSTFALRVEVLSQKYSQAISQYQSLQKQGKLTAVPYSLPKVPESMGLRLDGQLTQSSRGAMVILPMRDKTVKMWTEDAIFVNDFNNIILPNASFTP